VRDAPALLDVMAGYKPGDPYWAPAPARPFSEEATRPPGRLRIGVTAEPPLEAPVDPACRTALADAASLLAALGHEVEEACGCRKIQIRVISIRGQLRVDRSALAQLHHVSGATRCGIRARAPKEKQAAPGRG
jgi:Asp-tRNA(Asn)/Glu-tRNA(Gln) amidotransferase A subunit family amidase